MLNDGQRTAGKRIAFISSNFIWGGSETLWSECAATLAARGEKVRAYKNWLDRREGNVADLRRLSCSLVQLARLPLVPDQVSSRVATFTPYLGFAYQMLRLNLSLRLRFRPDLVVISQGGNHDGWPAATICRRLKLPYVLICQKATDLNWPQDRWLPHIQAAYAAARHVFFVSEQNRCLTEEQLGRKLGSASVVRNPFLVPWDGASPWPESKSGFGLACVGRLFPREKGQDILLRVLTAEKWRARGISVTFFGTGEQRESLESMARFHGLANVRFAGFENDVRAIWAANHALLLPSRAEGLPLVLVEAMLCGRVAIVTDVAGNSEVVDDGVTGFVAHAATEASFDEAMERAWQRREEWPEIGAAAAAAIRRLVQPDPAETLANELLRLMSTQSGSVAPTPPDGRAAIAGCTATGVEGGPMATQARYETLRSGRS